MKRPMLTQREAAIACGVIRRRREAGDLPNAVQDEARGWLIPVKEDLLAAGFRLNAPSGPAYPPRIRRPGAAGPTDPSAPAAQVVPGEIRRMRRGTHVDVRAAW
ncbi:hypothetical protein ACH4F3_36200 [Streptomyces anulatus]